MSSPQRRMSPPQRRVSPPQRRVSPPQRRASPPQHWRRLLICEDCNVSFNSEQQMGDHMRSERHRLRLLKLELEIRGGHSGHSNERKGPSRPTDGHYSGGAQWQRKQF
ncbi:Hypothetical predicted protein [Cloeon dipterum]|uniref:C2H2-type domain-containing protein n=1 Tax=Cloeon dipterum TaxID=197152 RepID=A0A8S1DMY7_9INSE|nr:Hypothetical predicted protein [Cloeon dipterum]